MAYELTRRQFFKSSPFVLYALSSACTTQEPSVERTSKPDVAKTLEQKAAEAPKRLSDEELLSAYQRFAEKVSPDIKTKLGEFAKRSGYTSLDEVLVEDYNSIIESAKNLQSNDNDIKLMLNLNENDVYRLIKHLRNNLDMSNSKRDKSTLYVAKAEQSQLPTFIDPNMLLHHPYGGISVPLYQSYSTSPFSIENPLVYESLTGMKAVLIVADEGRGAKYWIPFNNFSKALTDYTKVLIKEEIKSQQNLLDEWRKLMKQAKPDASLEDLNNLISENFNDRLGIIYSDYNLHGEGSQQVTHKLLKEIEAELQTKINSLNQLLK